MTTINEWAQAWAIPPAALLDLRARLGALDPGVSSTPGESEAAVQSRARVAASHLGMRVWRNNVGVFDDPERGIHVRFGLANDSAQLNRVIKSADLIGINPITVGPQHLGTVIGQFVSFECKHSGWRFAGTDREKAQHAWAQLVTAYGGLARFVTGVADVTR